LILSQKPVSFRSGLGIDALKNFYLLATLIGLLGKNGHIGGMSAQFMHLVKEALII